MPWAVRSQTALDARPSFPVDAYLQVRCIRDGHVETLPGMLRVGAIWGIDDKAPNARRSDARALGRIRDRSLTALTGQGEDSMCTVLLARRPEGCRLRR